MIKKKNFFDTVVSFVLILYLTELFRFSVVLGVPLSIFASLVTIILGVFLIKNKRLLRGMYRDRIVVLMTMFLIVIPLVAFPLYIYLGYLSFNEVPRVIGNNLLYLFLFVTSIIMGSKYGLTHFKKNILLPSICIAIFGLIYNYIDPALFLNLKLIIIGSDIMVDNENLNAIQRTGGFYLRSTYAATCIIPLLFFIFPSLDLISIKKMIIYFIIIFFLIFITGSRSMIIFLMLSLFFMYKYLKKNLIHKNRINAKMSVGVSNLLMTVFLILGGVSLLSFVYAFEGTDYASLGERIVSLTSTESISQDKSVMERTHAQLFYLDKIRDNPIIGHGPTYMYNLIHSSRSRSKVLSSHNSYLENSMRYGVFYVFLFVYIILLILKSKYRKIFKHIYHFDYIGLIILFIMFSSLASNTIWENKIIFILLGFSLGVAVNQLPQIKKNRL